ncbi:MAG TPA: tetratricopeptide repeat protein [Candidatus Saccharimonadales bacterium]|nr:tetratricopeptide repeat protein [Candidatus Saccharimonadales bacterium]
MKYFWLSRLFPRNARNLAYRAALLRAEGGDAEAQFGLGLRFSVDGDSQDLPKAAEWYRKAAGQNHHLAQFNLGIMLSRGHGIEKDDSAALVWMQRAAASGDAGAQFNLGNRCQRESMVGSGPASAEFRIEAYKWFSLSAAQGYKDSATFFERASYGMSRDEVTEGIQRASAFVVAE